MSTAKLSKLEILPDSTQEPPVKFFSCVQDGREKHAALHLPVAPRCNIQCAYCDRSGDCVNNSPRGNTSVLLTPKQAVAYALESLRREPRIKSVGITGPGDPLANGEAVFDTLTSLRAARSDIPFFLATNGLGLSGYVERLRELGVSLCTVTVNSVRSEVVARIVDWVQAPDRILAGTEAAEYLVEQQLSGIRAAVTAGITVRVNFQVIPTINELETESVAREVSAAGATHFHVQPFVCPPSRNAAFADLPAANEKTVGQARQTAARYLELVKHCTLCAADSMGCLAQVPNVRSALEMSAKNKDDSANLVGTASEDNASGDERRVALRQLQLIAKVARWLAITEDDTAETMRRVLAWLDEELGLKRAVIALVDAAGETLQAQVAHGVAPDQLERMRYHFDEGVTGQVFSAGQPVLLASLQADPNFLERSGLRAGLDLSKLAFFCVPIRDRGSIIGTLSADKDNSRLKDADSDLKLLGEIAQLFAPVLQRRRLEESLSLFRRLRSTEGPFARLLGRSPAMEEVRRLLSKVAAATTSVLFLGETGTGKSAAAALLHELSPRASSPFVEVNCGAIPENLIESELFGHEKGAFTGAAQRRLGVFERARGGTVFLDEVAELGPSAQTRLLRVLQTHRFERVGGSDTLTTDVRLIAATNKDLAAAVAEGSFRADLFYRLNVFPITMPPLRERGKADLMLLADSLIDRLSRSMGKSIFRIDTPAIDMITKYHWPGNVRELENVLERAVVLAEGEVIHGHHLPPSLQLNQYASTPENLDFATRVANFEIELITEALKDTNGNQTKAAERLGLTKRIIQYKIRNYAIPWERFVPRG